MTKAKMINDIFEGREICENIYRASGGFPLIGIQLSAMSHCFSLFFGQQ